MKWNFTINYEKNEYKNFLLWKKIDLILEKTISVLGIMFKGHFILNVVEQKTMQKINENYYPFKKISNILALVLSKECFNTDFNNPLGEIYFCFPVIWKESGFCQKKFLQNSINLFLHSFLHLLGYDHKNKKEDELMNGLKRKILKEIKII